MSREFFRILFPLTLFRRFRHLCLQPLLHSFDLSQKVFLADIPFRVLIDPFLHDPHSGIAVFIGIERPLVCIRSVFVDPFKHMVNDPVAFAGPPHLLLHCIQAKHGTPLVPALLLFLFRKK